MIYIFLIFGFLTLAVFFVYSKYEGGVLNAFFIFTLLKFAVEFVLEPISWWNDIYSYRPDVFFKIYLISFIFYAGIVLGAIRFRRRPSAVKSVKFQAISEKLAWLLLASAFLLYFPILFEFREYIFEPRYIYEQTRTGYGLQFFGSALLTYAALISFLFSTRRKHILFLMLCSAFILLKGQKGQFITGCAIYIVWFFYVKNVRLGVAKTSVIAAFGVGAFTALFALNYRGEIESLLFVIAGYSDYNRNAALVLQDPQLQPYGGQIIAEGFVLSKIPRVIWEGKPKNFGPFRLADRYFPEWFELDQGAPAFGVGVLYADFGEFSYLFALLGGLISGSIFKFFLRRFLAHPGILYFVMVLFCSGIELIPAGIGYFILEHFLFAYLLNKFALFFTKKKVIEFHAGR